MVQGVKVGLGQLFMKDKTMVEGYWNDDELLGIFLMYKPDGNVFIGENNKGLKGFVMKYDYIIKKSQEYE